MTSDIGNKEVFARNLKYYIVKSGKDRRELAKIWGFPYSTVSEWVNAKKYPRIDRIEIMAEYFGILKSDLIESKTDEQREEEELNRELVDMLTDLNVEEVRRVLDFVAGLKSSRK